MTKLCTVFFIASFKWLDSDSVWPKVVIYNTVKNKGVTETEGKNIWHGAPITNDVFNEGILQLENDIKTKEAFL